LYPVAEVVDEVELFEVVELEETVELEEAVEREETVDVLLVVEEDVALLVEDVAIDPFGN